MEYSKDSIVNSIVQKFISRSDLGIQKYGTTLDRDDLKTVEWIQHVQEELMDAILYIQSAREELAETTPNIGLPYYVSDVAT